MVYEYYKDVRCKDYSRQGCDIIEISPKHWYLSTNYTPLHHRKITLIFTTVTTSYKLRFH
jgi:hypothetical protein